MFIVILEILKIILISILVFCVLLFFGRIYVYFNYIDDKIYLKIKFLFIKLNLTKLFEKKDKPKNIKPKKKLKKTKAAKSIKKASTNSGTQSEITHKQTIKSNAKLKQEKPKKTKSKNIEISDILDTVSDGVDILSKLTNTFVVKKFDVKIKLQTSDNAKTGQLIGVFYIFYGFFTAFLQSNFIVKEYEFNITPLWDTDKTEIHTKANIIIYTSVFRVVRNIKYKSVFNIIRRFKK